MTTYVCLLRAINVGGTGKISMSSLLGLLAELGFEGGKSLLQTGNLVCRAEGKNPSDLEHLLETETFKRLNLKTDFMIRTGDEWEKIIARNPFPKEATTDPSHLLVVFLKNAPGKTAQAALRESITGREEIRIDGKQAYAIYPDGIGRSRLTSGVIEAKLNTRGTARNWNTVLKIAALLSGSFSANSTRRTLQ